MINNGEFIKQNYQWNDGRQSVQASYYRGRLTFSRPIFQGVTIHFS